MTLLAPGLASQMLQYDFDYRGRRSALELLHNASATAVRVAQSRYVTIYYLSSSIPCFVESKICKVKLLWHPDVISISIVCSLTVNSLKIVAKLLLFRTNLDLFQSFFLFLFFSSNIFFNIGISVTGHSVARHTNTLPLCILQQNCRSLFTPYRISMYHVWACHPEIAEITVRGMASRCAVYHCLYSDCLVACAIPCKTNKLQWVYVYSIVWHNTWGAYVTIRTGTHISDSSNRLLMKLPLCGKTSTRESRIRDIETTIYTLPSVNTIQSNKLFMSSNGRTCNTT